MSSISRINRSLLSFAVLLGIGFSEAPASNEPEQLTVVSLTTDALVEVCHFLDPVSLNRLSQTSKTAESRIKNELSHYLFLPKTKDEIEILLSSDSFPILFRKASNTEGGLLHLINYPGFFPSHFKSVYPISAGIGENPTPLCQQEFNFIKRNLIKLLPTDFVDENNEIKKGAPFPSYEEAKTMATDDVFGLIDHLFAKVQKMKVVAIFAPEIYTETVQLPYNNLYLTPPFSTNTKRPYDYCKTELSAHYLKCLIETPDSFRDFIRVFANNSNYALAVENRILHAVVHCIEAINNDPTQDATKLSQTLNAIVYYAHHVFIPAGDTSHKKFMEYIKEYLNKIIEKDNTPTQLRLHAINTLLMFGGEYNQYEKCVEDAADQNVFTAASIYYLWRINHPKTTEGAFKVLSDYLMTLEECNSFHTKPDYRHLKSLTRSANKEHRELAKRFVSNVYKTDGENNTQKLALERYKLSTCAPIKVLMNSDPTKAKQFLLNYVATQAYDLEDNPSYFPPLKNLVWSARHFVTMFNDQETMKSILDAIYQYAIDSKLTTKGLLKLTKAYIQSDDMDKAKLALIIAEDSLKNEEDADPNLLNKLAYINAVADNTENAKSLFIKASEAITANFIQATESKELSEFKQATNDLLSLAIDMHALKDITFAEPVLRPVIELIKTDESSTILLDAIFCSLSKGLGMDEEKLFFFKRIQNNLNLLRRSSEKEELAAVLEISSDKLVKLSQDELIEMVIEKGKKDYFSSWSYKELKS